jgi:P4 family phage/plasmid primase-like protien
MSLILPTHLQVSREQVIERLQSLGLPALPVAPAQDAQKYPARQKDGSIKLDKDEQPIPAFTGKNPSSLDKAGKPHQVNHREYQSRLPNDKEQKLWFTNPANGIGTLGGWQNIHWLDLDVKHFDSQEACARALEKIFDTHPKLRESWIERTHSGGWHVAIKLKQKPDFTNFALTPGGEHVGEVLGEGRFCVLAPTIGPSGNPYETVHYGTPVEVESLEAINIYPTKVRGDRQNQTEQPKPKPKPSSQHPIYLQYLGTDASRAILNGENPTGDRSEALTTAVREWCGWEDWAESQGIAINGSAEALAFAAGEKLGIDQDRITRILKTIEPSECHPAALHRGGEESCWLKIRRLDGETFRKKCPSAVKQSIYREQVARERQISQSQASSGTIPIKYTKSGEPKLPGAATVACVLAEKYRDTLAWNIEAECFYRYAADVNGLWQREPDDCVNAIIQAELDSTELWGLYGASYIKSTYTLLRGYLAVRKWDETSGLLPLRNGVLNLATNQLAEHSPGYRLTWQLPYDYDLQATCEPIQEWLLETQNGDRQRVELLRAYLKAIVTGRTDLQRFIECIGPGGSGKSTYARLAIALIGLNNSLITDLKSLETNRFETSGVYRKRLVLITDSERYGGNVTVLKSLTGQDALRFEEKFKQNRSGFIPEAMVLIAANEPIQSADYTSGLERRRITVPFLNQVAAEKQRDLITINDRGVAGEFVEFLPGLLNWVLAMPDSEVTTLIKNTSVSVPSLNQWKSENLLESNPIAFWFDHCCVLEPDTKTYIGVAKRDKNPDSSNRYLHIESWLYASYKEFYEATNGGNFAVSSVRFTGLLHDLCHNQLKRLEIRKGRDNRGSYFEGIAIRTDRYAEHPRPVTGNHLEDEQSSNDLTDGDVTGVTASDGCSDGLNPLSDKACDECDGLKQESVSFQSVETAHQIFGANSKKFNTGDRVRYIGNNPIFYKEYGGVELTIATVNCTTTSCRKPDQSYTTWIPLSDLEPWQGGGLSDNG